MAVKMADRRAKKKVVKMVEMRVVLRVARKASKLAEPKVVSLVEGRVVMLVGTMVA